MLFRLARRALQQVGRSSLARGAEAEFLGQPVRQGDDRQHKQQQ
jgi:hypothetical protein